MKKAISIIFVLSFLFTILIIPTSAAPKDDLSEYQTIDLTKFDRMRMTDEEKFEQKLLAIGIQESFFDVLKEKFFEKIVSAKTATVLTSFYVENEDYTDLIQTSKSNYNAALYFAREQAPEIIETPNKTYPLDQGTLQLHITLITSDNLNYICLANAYWSTMPYNRCKDTLGLSRVLSDVTVKPETAFGYYNETYDEFFNGQEKQIVEAHGLLFDDLKHSTDGYAMEFPVNPNIQPGVLSPDYWRHYQEVAAMIGYEGIIKSNVEHTNHFLAFAHQKINLGFLNEINFSIPFSLGFSMGLKFTYDEITREHIWER